MVGLSLAATLLAVVLVVGLLAWVRRDLRVRGVPARVWWLVVGCYALAAVAWLLAITLPLPIAVAWVATVPAAVATIAPERIGAVLGGIGGGVARRPRRSRPHAMARPTGAPRPMASRSPGLGARPGLVRRRSSAAPTEVLAPASTSSGTASLPSAANSPSPSPPPSSFRPRPPIGSSAPLPASVPASTLRAAPTPVPEPNMAAPAAVASRRSVAISRRHWHAGDLRLAVELLQDAARIPDLDDAARARIETRLTRLDRFHEPATDELLALVRDDVHARLAMEVAGLDPDSARASRIAALLDELDPRPLS